MNKIFSCSIAAISVLSTCALFSNTFADCPDPAAVTIDNTDNIVKVVAPEGTHLQSVNFGTEVTPASPIRRESVSFVSRWGASEGPYEAVVPMDYNGESGIICTYIVGITPTGTDRPQNSFKLAVDNSSGRYFKLRGNWKVENTAPAPEGNYWSYSCNDQESLCSFEKVTGL